MRQYTVQPLKAYLEAFLEPLQNGEGPSSVFEDVVSFKEVRNAKLMFEHASSEESLHCTGQAIRSEPRLSNLAQSLQRLHVYERLLQGLMRLQGKAAYFSLRCLVRFCLEDPLPLRSLVNFSLGCHLYRLFTILVKQDFSKRSLDSVFNGSPNHFVVLLSLFEIALFSNQVV